MRIILYLIREKKQTLLRPVRKFVLHFVPSPSTTSTCCQLQMSKVCWLSFKSRGVKRGEPWWPKGRPWWPKIFSTKIFLKKIFLPKMFLKITLLPNIFLKKWWWRSILAARGWYRAKARSQPSITYLIEFLSVCVTDGQ